jgi:hypothetical protein
LAAPFRSLSARLSSVPTTLNAKRNGEAYFEAVYVRNADGSFRQLERAEFVADATTGSAAEINAIRDALVTAGLMKPS